MGEKLEALLAVSQGVLWLVLWAITIRAIIKQADDPEWQEHKDDPDYWDWP